MSEVTIVGNCGDAPSLRFTPNGLAVSEFSVAINRKKGEEESTDWVDVVAWRDLAENVAESLTKGMRVIVSGRMEQSTWTTDDGSKRSKLRIVADEIGPSFRWATGSVVRNERSA